MTATEKIIQNIDDAVTLYMRRSGCTQGEFASKVNLSEPQLSRKRKGDADWKMTEVVAISEIVDTPISKLMSF